MNILILDTDTFMDLTKDTDFLTRAMGRTDVAAVPAVQMKNDPTAPRKLTARDICKAMGAGNVEAHPYDTRVTFNRAAEELNALLGL